MNPLGLLRRCGEHWVALVLPPGRRARRTAPGLHVLRDGGVRDPRPNPVDAAAELHESLCGLHGEWVCVAHGPVGPREIEAPVVWLPGREVSPRRYRRTAAAWGKRRRSAKRRTRAQHPSPSSR